MQFLAILTALTARDSAEFLPLIPLPAMVVVMDGTFEFSAAAANHLKG